MYITRTVELTKRCPDCLGQTWRPPLWNGQRLTYQSVLHVIWLGILTCGFPSHLSVLEATPILYRSTMVHQGANDGHWRSSSLQTTQQWNTKETQVAWMLLSKHSPEQGHLMEHMLAIDPWCIDAFTDCSITWNVVGMAKRSRQSEFDNNQYVGTGVWLRAQKESPPPPLLVSPNHWWPPAAGDPKSLVTPIEWQENPAYSYLPSTCTHWWFDWYELSIY